MRICVRTVTKGCYYLCCRGKKVIDDVERSDILACIARNVNEGVRRELLDDNSIESLIDVDDTIFCSNSKCVTYDKEYSFESVHITAAPEGDWFCPSCRELPSAHICVAQESVVVNCPCYKGLKTSSNSVR